MIERWRDEMHTKYGCPTANLSLLLLDVDHFKQVNDRQGHLAGDDLLRGLARLVTDHVRRGDLAARFGGDELAVVLPRAGGD